MFTPTLSVHNATDPDKDLLTYEFEVYADAAMTNLVAQSGPIAEAPLVTGWTVPGSAHGEPDLLLARPCL